MMEQIGRYRIVSELGRGAMGVVYHAIDPTIGRSVAIKTIRIRDIDNEAERQRLRDRLFREARSAGVLSHPNIVTIYDMDDEADGLAYIAMAYVNGPTLEKILASDKPLSGSTMLRILRQTALALDYAHGKGIIHRDVKPANIMTDEDGAVKVTDFGIAKIASGMHSTGTKTIVGTPNYMSPEQVQGLTVDGRSDQFSLAVIAYEILTGERPFTGEHLSTVIFKIVDEDPAPAHRINGTLTQQIDDALRKGLSKKPEDRYMSCSAFVGALEMACAESRGWRTLAAGAVGAMPTAEVELGSASPEPAPEAPAPVPRRPWRLPVALGGIAAVLAISAFLAWRTGEFTFAQPAPPPAPSRPVAKAEEPKIPEPDTVEPPTAEPPEGTSDAANEKRASNEKPASAPPASSPIAPDNGAAGAPTQHVLGKPSPLTVPAVQSEPEPSIRETVRIPQAPPQDVWVTSNPPGAKAVMDGDVSHGCATPCMLQAAPGVHHLTVAQNGFSPEYREIHVEEQPMEVPAITLRLPSGTLMITSNLPGASIFINGQQFHETTPAQLSLPPGTYDVRVEKNGKSQSQTVQLHESPLYLKLPLQP